MRLEVVDFPCIVATDVHGVISTEITTRAI